MIFIHRTTGNRIATIDKELIAIYRSDCNYKVAKDADFKESDHPRDNSGKFTSGGGGGGKSAEPSKRTPEQGQHLKGKLLQPDVNRLQPGQRKELVKLYEKAAAAKDTFDAKNTSIAKAVGGKAAIVPLKGSTRAVDKIIGDYNGDPSQIKDLLRTTIEINDLGSVDKVMEKLGKEYKIEEKGFRNLLKEGTDSLGGTGYRDIKMNVKINGVTAEVQVNFPEMLKAKESMHGHYEEVSAILRAAAKTKGILKPQDAERITQLNNEMKEAYDAVWDKMLKRSAR